MKFSSFIWLLFVIGLYCLNYYVLKISLIPFTGIVLGILIILIIIVNVIVKFRKRKQDEKQGITDNTDFIFPKEVAKKMKEINIATQYEASILSMSFLIIGALLFVIYTVFFTTYYWLMKVFICFNSVCAIILMTSTLITTYQQFVAHKESTNMMNLLSTNSIPGITERLTLINN